MIPFASADKVSIGERLRSERERLGFTLGGLAKVAGIRSAVQDSWERGEDWPHLIELNAYARVGLDLSFVITGVRSQMVAAEGVNAVDALRERVGAGSDSALARMLDVSPSAVCRWRQHDCVPEKVLRTPARGSAYTPGEIKRGISLLPPAARRTLVLELMSGELGG